MKKTIDPTQTLILISYQKIVIISKILNFNTISKIFVRKYQKLLIHRNQIYTSKRVHGDTNIR